MTSWLWAAVGSMAAWTVWALALKAGVARLGAVQTTLVSLVAELTVMVSLVLGTGTAWMGGGKAGEPTSVSGFAYAAGAGLFGASGLLLYCIALRGGSVAVATAVTSAYPAAVVVVSVAVLGERLSPLSSIGILLAVVGVVLIGLDSPQK